MIGFRKPLISAGTGAVSRFVSENEQGQSDIHRTDQFEPEDMGSKTKWYFLPNAYIREVIGVMYYKWESIVIVLIPIAVFLIAIRFVG